jgi:lipopolysaccharide transport system permease protein
MKTNQGFKVAHSIARSPQAYWRELWSYRELFYFLAWRDLLVRYKQTTIGLAWAILRPLLSMVVLVFVFSKVAKLPSDATPYPVLVLCGLLPWQFFSNSVTEAGSSLITNANMISKVYFPRVIVPASSVLVAFVDLLVSGLILAVMMLAYGVFPSSRILFVPLFVLGTAALALGVSLWTAALSVAYRDFRYIIPFAMQLGIYVTPVGFASGIVPDAYRTAFSLNPLVGLIDGFRWTLLPSQEAPGATVLLMTTGIIVAVLASGIAYFRRVETNLADTI